MKFTRLPEIRATRLLLFRSLSRLYSGDDYQKDLLAETETSRISFKTSSTNQRLLCMETNGEEDCFSPAR